MRPHDAVAETPPSVFAAQRIVVRSAPAGTVYLHDDRLASGSHSIVLDAGHDDVGDVVDDRVCSSQLQRG